MLCGNAGSGVQGETDKDGCTLAFTVRIDFKAAAQLADSFAHTAKADSGRSCDSHFVLLRWRKALAFVRYPHDHLAVDPFNANLCNWTSGMPMNVGQAFLNYTKDSSLHLTGEASELGGEIKVNLDLTALGEAIRVPAKR